VHRQARRAGRIADEIRGDARVPMEGAFGTPSTGSISGRRNEQQHVEV
jgi:hypothetical protein